MSAFSRIAKRFLSYLLIPVIFLYLVSIVDLEAAFATYSNTNPTLIVLAFSLSFLYPLVGAARWKAVLFAFDERHLSKLNATTLIVGIMTWWQSKVEHYFLNFD